MTDKGFQETIIRDFAQYAEAIRRRDYIFIQAVDGTRDALNGIAIEVEAMLDTWLRATAEGNISAAISTKDAEDARELCELIYINADHLKRIADCIREYVPIE